MSLLDEAHWRDWKSPTVLFEEEFDSHPNRNLVLKIMEVAKTRKDEWAHDNSRPVYPVIRSAVAQSWLGKHGHWAPMWACDACVALLARPELSYLFDLNPLAVAALAGSGNEDAHWVLSAVHALYEGDGDAEPNG